jgi:hypothetical protein
MCDVLLPPGVNPTAVKYTECPRYKYTKINAYIFVLKIFMNFIFSAWYRVTQKVFNARQYTSMWAPVVA